MLGSSPGRLVPTIAAGRFATGPLAVLATGPSAFRSTARWRRLSDRVSLNNPPAWAYLATDPTGRTEVAGVGAAGRLWLVGTLVGTQVGTLVETLVGTHCTLAGGLRPHWIADGQASTPPSDPS